MFQDYILKGGIEWMLPIILLSVVALALSMERSFFWCCFFLKNRRFRKELKLVSAPPFSIERAIERSAMSSNPILRTLHSFLSNLKQSDIEQAEAHAFHEIDQVVAETRTGLDVLTFIANVSGTLGLLGTVVGVSMAMESIGLDDPVKLTSSLSIALYTTVAGVLLFIFSYFFFFVFNKFSNALESELSKQLNLIKSMTQQKS